MTLTVQKKASVISDYQRSANDSGSVQVQVAVLSEKIISLTGHMRTHKHDYASRKGLLGMVSKRNRLLKYLARKNRAEYLELIGRLGLRK